MLNLLKAGALALAMPCLASNTQPPVVPSTTLEITLPDPYRGSFEAVPQIECTQGRGTGVRSGTGVRISDDIVITAAHVVHGNGLCSIDGKPAEPIYDEPGRDFSALRVKLGHGYRANVSCEGIIAGERYYAYGYAHGGKPNVEPLIGTNYKNKKSGAVRLIGRVFPGMSGGKVANRDGAFVAITVMFNTDVDWAYVIPLTETYLCRRG